MSREQRQKNAQRQDCAMWLALLDHTARPAVCPRGEFSGPCAYCVEIVEQEIRRENEQAKDRPYDRSQVFA